VKVLLVPSINGRVYPDIRIGLPSFGILRRLQAFKPDIIHTFTPLVLGLQGIILAKHLHVPHVSSHLTNYTDEEMLKAVKYFPDIVLRQTQKGAGAFIRWFLNYHQAVLVPSEDTRRDILSMGVTVPIHTIPMPIAYEALVQGKKKGTHLRKQLGIGQAILYAGRMSGEKNIDQVLQTFHLLLKKKPKTKLVLIGDGQERSSLFKLATKLRINQSIVWVGQVPHAELLQQGYYYLGDVFLTLSEFETQGLSTLEAMACGLPVVGARSRATSEIVETVGILVSPQRKTEIVAHLSDLLSRKTLSAQYQAASITKAKEFSIPVCIPKLLDVYELVRQDTAV